MSATLHFHSNASKSAFIGKNGISPSEILAETPSSITLEDVEAEGFANSPYVHSVTTNPPTK